MVQKGVKKGDKEAKRVELGIETVSDESEMQSKGNEAKCILIGCEADREKGGPLKTGVNARRFYVIVLHSQKYKNITSYYC